VDQTTGQYFLADDTHQAVAWFDATTNTFMGLLAPGLFAGSGTAACHAFTPDPFGCGGPTGVLTDDLGRVWAGDSPTPTDLSSSVVVINPTTNTSTVINTGGHARSDELAFDPVDHVVLIANPDDGFLTWISTTTLSVVGKFYYSGNADGVTPTVANHPAAGGLEQPVFDPQTGLFYQAVPGVGVDVFEPVPANGVGQLVTTFDLPSCASGPTGLVLGPNDKLIGGCDNGGAVVDLHNGQLHTIIPNVGGADEVWFNAGDTNVYFAQIVPTATGVTFELGVADANNEHFLQTLPSGPGAHSVAAYEGNNEIFVPVAGQGIFVYQSGAQ
jgi:hypothetical protein